MIPQKIKIVSDSNELQYQSSNKAKDVHQFLYTKSKTKKDQILTITQEILDKHIKNKIIEVL